LKTIKPREKSGNTGEQNKPKENKMTPVYDPKAKGWRIVYTPNQFIKREMWGKPVNNKIYESWDSACHDLDKWAE
jgi:hypothetical protein